MKKWLKFGPVFLVMLALSHSAAYGDMKKKEPLISEKKEMIKQKTMGMLVGSEDHHASGKVEIIEDKMGHASLIFSDFNVDKVPDGRVYLAKNHDFRNGVEVGKLAIFMGRVEFKIPSGTHLEDYDSVVIWCKKFNVEIGRGTFETAMNQDDPSMMDH